MLIKQVFDKEEKKFISRTILEALPAWFGIAEARENYIEDSQNQAFFCAVSEQEPAGFLCLKETGKDTVELAVMGVLQKYHRQGIGRRLLEAAKDYAAQEGYSFLQVKTVQMGRYPEYDDTNKFYISTGFREFEVFPALWDEWNPCQIYVMSLK